MQGWSSFCRMLKEYVDIVDYSHWFSTIPIKAPFQPLVEKQSYAATVKSKISYQSLLGSGKMEPRPISNRKVHSQVLVCHPPSIKKQ